MKILKLLIISLFFTQICFSQTVIIQAGTSLTSLDWKVGAISIYNQTKIGYSVFAGIDFLDHRYYNLSCNVGMVNKGGKDEMIYANENGEEISNSILKVNLNYVSVNAVVNFKYTIKEKFIPFLSIGPRLDYLVNYSDDIKSLDAIDDMGELKKINYGLLLGGGIKYDFSKFQFGVRADYLLNFAKIAEWSNKPNYSDLSIQDKTFIFNFTIGYKLK